MKIEICCGCKKELKKPEETFSVSIFSKEFWDGVDYGYILEHRCFCFNCATDIKNTLKKIAEND